MSHPLPAKLWIASDHAGFPLKEFLIEHRPDLPWSDLGAFSTDSVDYPDQADQVAVAVLSNRGTGILICGSGQGVAMRANKYKEIRAALCWDKNSAELSRRHNDANILCMGARLIPFKLALEILEVFVSTPFEGGRHLNRVQKISLPLKA